MKKLLVAALLSLSAVSAKSQEKYGNTLNVGLGLNYAGYYYASPAFHLNYEFDVMKNLTVAPFITFSTYRNYVYWGNPYKNYGNYYYRETIIPVGAKVSYYFDELFEAGSDWDFYFAASIGYAFRKTTWDNGYEGNTVVHSYGSNFVGILHIGAEYHINNKVGIFADLATGYSTIGLGIHL